MKFFDYEVPKEMENPVVELKKKLEGLVQLNFDDYLLEQKLKEVILKERKGVNEK